MGRLDFYHRREPAAAHAFLHGSHAMRLDPVCYFGAIAHTPILMTSSPATEAQRLGQRVDTAARFWPFTAAAVDKENHV